MFTKERVTAAYKKAEIKPINSRFTDVIYQENGNDVLCGCALTAILIAECGMTWKEVKDFADTCQTGVGDMSRFAAEKLGESAVSIEAFINGFDGWHNSRNLSANEAGYATWDAVKDGIPDEA